MATDATGTPTSKGIPKYNTAVDAPSGKGFNASMDSIDTLLDSYIGKPAGIVSGEVPVWNGAAWVRSSVTRINTVRPQDLSQDGAASGNVLAWNGAIWAPSAASTGANVLNRVTATTDVVNTVAETTLYTFTVPGGSLSTNKVLRLIVIGDVLYNNVNTDTATLRVKYGATTVLNSGAVDLGALQATRANYQFTVWLQGMGATNSQRGFFGAADEDGSTAHPIRSFVTGTAAEDSTVNKDLVITIQWSAASVNNSYRLLAATLELK